MPYPNEHAVRLRSPSAFADNPVWRNGVPGKFRRTKTTSVLGKQASKQFSVIWGKLKGKSGKNGHPIPQSLRFPKSSWTIEEVRNWIKKSGLSYVSIEAAG